ncbi:hypothetical protein JCM8097_003447 [Rhodosporidiobolus ruineniae]
MLTALRLTARRAPSSASSALASSSSAARSAGQRRAASGVHYNEPTGRLFGEKAPAPGQKRVKEDWENIYIYGFGGAMLFGGILRYYKPDTSIEGWAREQAKERLASKGETPSYQKSE